MNKKDLSIPFNVPLNPQDTEQQTYGCRANNPDICGNNGLPNICAFFFYGLYMQKAVKSLEKAIQQTQGLSR